DGLGLEGDGRVGGGRGGRCLRRRGGGLRRRGRGPRRVILSQQNRAREGDGEGEQSGEFLHLRSLPSKLLTPRRRARFRLTSLNRAPRRMERAALKPLALRRGGVGVFRRRGRGP